MDDALEKTNWVLESLLNHVPCFHYRAADSTTFENEKLKLFFEHAGLVNKKYLRSTSDKDIRYHPANWYTTTFTLRMSKIQSNGSKVRRVNKTQNEGETPDAISLSRTELIERLHQKISELRKEKKKETGKKFKKKTNSPKNTQVKEEPFNLKNEENCYVEEDKTVEKRTSKRRRLFDAFHAAQEKQALLSQLPLGEKEDVEKSIAREEALRRAAGERTYTNMKKLKKALKGGKKRNNSKKQKRR